MSNRVSFTPGCLVSAKKSRRRFRCDGHLNPVRHYVEAGDSYVVSALPPRHPDIGNIGWWHMRFCMDCCPAQYDHRTLNSGSSVAADKGADA